MFKWAERKCKKHFKKQLVIQTSPPCSHLSVHQSVGPLFIDFRILDSKGKFARNSYHRIKLYLYQYLLNNIHQHIGPLLTPNVPTRLSQCYPKGVDNGVHIVLEMWNWLIPHQAHRNEWQWNVSQQNKHLNQWSLFLGKVYKIQSATNSCWRSF